MAVTDSYLCCLADGQGDYYAVCEIEAVNVSEAVQQAWDVADKFQGCAGMTLFCGDVRVFTNVPKAYKRGFKARASRTI